MRNIFNKKKYPDKAFKKNIRKTYFFFLFLMFLFGLFYTLSSKEERMFKRAVLNNSLVQFRNYQKEYPEGKYNWKAKKHIARFYDMVLLDTARFYSFFDKDSVTVQAFYIDQFEVSVADFANFVKQSNYITDAEKKGWSYVLHKGQIQAMKGVNWRHNVRGLSYKREIDQIPVIHISWNDAKAFAEWNNKRLPTAREWEFAAKGGNNSKITFSFSGNNNVDKVAWYRRNSAYSVHQSGLKLPNELDIFDMSGNVWEWCADEWHKQLSDTIHTEKKRIIRGGSWTDFGPAQQLNVLQARNQYFSALNVGFRCAKNVK